MMMPALPPLQLSASGSAKGGEFFGGDGGNWTEGDWIVSTGSGAASSSGKTWLAVAALAALCAWIARKKS